nr:RHS repeat domain-containing protein [Streptomyces sp. NRRL F-3218]
MGGPPRAAEVRGRSAAGGRPAARAGQPATHHSSTAAATAAGLLGRGWAGPFDSKFTVATGKATYRADDGASFVFTRNSGGTYASPAGSRAKLVEGTSDYVLTTPDHTRRTFTSGGQLTSVADKAGKGLTLTYASGRLASVKDAAGRTTTFTVGADGLLTKAALPDTTSVSYGYTGDLLTSVTDPAGKTSSYTHDANQRLSSYTDPAGGKVGNTYETAGRITSQTDQNGAAHPQVLRRQHHRLHLRRRRPHRHDDGRRHHHLHLRRGGPPHQDGTAQHGDRGTHLRPSGPRHRRHRHQGGHRGHQDRPDAVGGWPAHPRRGHPGRSRHRRLREDLRFVRVSQVSWPWPRPVPQGAARPPTTKPRR